MTHIRVLVTKRVGERLFGSNKKATDMTIRTESSPNSAAVHSHQSSEVDKSGDVFQRTLDGLKWTSIPLQPGTSRTTASPLFDLARGTNVPGEGIRDLKEGAHWSSGIFSLIDKTTLKPMAPSSAKLDSAASVATPQRPLLRIPAEGNQGPPPPNQQAAITLAEIQQLAPETPHSAAKAKQVDTLLAKLETNPGDLNKALQGLDAQELVAILNQPGGAKILTAGPRAPGSGSHALSVLIESDPQNIVQQLQNVHDYQALTNYAYAELQQGKPGRGQLGLLLLQLKFGSPPDPQNPYKYINDPGKYKDHQHALTLGFFLGCVDGAIRTDSQNAEDQQQATNNLIQNLWPIIGDVPLPGSEYVAQLGEAITSQYKGDLTQIENSNASFEKKLQDLATYTSDPQTGGLLSPGANSQFRSGFDEGNQTL